MTITLEEAVAFLKQRDNFTILAHANPDGDTMGSCHALCGALQRIGKKAAVKCADPLSERFDYLRDGIIEQSFEEQTIVSVDVADERLLGALEEVYSGKIDLCIDHHMRNMGFAKQQYVDSDAAAAAEIVFELIKLLGVTVDVQLAVSLYTGIATDTGCFKFANTTSRTHRITAELMEANFDFGTLNYKLFDMKTKARIKLEQEITSNMSFYFGDRCAVAVLTKEMLDSVDVEDSNGVAAIPRQISGVEVGVTIKQKKPDVWKASLRTTNTVDAQEICSELGGGGHKRAAGCNLYGTLEQAKAALLPAIEKRLK